MSEKKALLSLEDVAFGYDLPNIVTDINLSLQTNQRVAIAGQNGVGKSSLLHTIMGLTPCVTGNIFFEDHNITHVATHKIAKMGIALVRQEHAIFADLTVMEHFHVLQKDFKKSMLTEKLSCFPELINKARHLGKNLSGGQRQQLAIALALATKPKLLLLDEPSANVQPSIIEDIISKLLTITKETGMSIIIAEQNLLVINNLTERTYIIESGKVIESEKIIESSKNVASAQQQPTNAF